ncbi:MAG: lipopolysaccharide biosynthesis protein, partial [Armatimonadota bacterium]
MQSDDFTVDALESLGSRARTAIAWKFLSQGMTYGVQIVTGIVLARLLMPKDFGVLGMATMVTGLVQIFQDLGMGQALVQRREVERRHVSAAFWGTLVMGALLCGLAFLIAPYVGVFFKEPRMVPVLRTVALTFVISPFGTIPYAMLQRKMDFRTPFYSGIAGALAYGAVGVTMALQGYGYWSLVGGLLSSTFASVLVLCVITRHLPPLVPNFNGMSELLNFGVGATGVGIFSYIAQQADYFVVGRRLDSAALGLYTRAFTLVHQP